MISHRELVTKTTTNKATLEWLLERNYIFSTKVCLNCSNQMQIKFKNLKNVFRCSKCRNETSIFQNSIFFNNKLTIIKSVEIIYFWCNDFLQIKVKNEINCANNATVFLWFNKLRFFSYKLLLRERNQKIGGRGYHVQIDESLFSKRKYNVGREVRKLWVVGGICTETNETFFVETLFRNIVSLNEIILNNVAEGSIITTDEWAGYNQLSSLGYIHQTVNHCQNFINPETGANTQQIEATWAVTKKWLRKKGVSNRSMLFLYFSEYCLKRKYKENIFEKIMSEVKNYEELINN